MIRFKEFYESPVFRWAEPCRLFQSLQYHLCGAKKSMLSLSSDQKVNSAFLILARSHSHIISKPHVLLSYLLYRRRWFQSQYFLPLCHNRSKWPKPGTASPLSPASAGHHIATEKTLRWSHKKRACCSLLYPTVNYCKYLMGERK